MTNWWRSVNGEKLAQGDLLPECLLPNFSHLSPNEISGVVEAGLNRTRLIVMTQSCDLNKPGTQFVVLCQIMTIPEFESVNVGFKKGGAWENARKGRYESLHLLASPDHPENNRESLVVDFGHIVSLPIEYLANHAKSFDQRWRLVSPFLEHFSQSFARFFMRVGLPSDISPFK